MVFLNKLSNPCFWKFEKFTSFHRNGTSYSTVPSFVNILNHSWLKIWGNMKKKVSFFFHFQISSIHASWPSLWTAFTHDFPIWKVSMTSWSDHVKLGRDFTRHDGDKLKDHSIIRLLFLIILPCVALKTEAKTAIKHRKSHPDRNLFSFSLPYGTKHFREEDKERRITPSVRVWSVIC